MPNQFANMSLFMIVFCIALIHSSSANINEGPVCSITIRTFPSYEALLLVPNESVLHCGNCGECSNTQDINIYYDTRNTLTKTTRNCAIKSLIPVYGMYSARHCLDKKVGFTKGCLNCWVANITCTRKKCLKTCLAYFFFGLGDFVGMLNPCLACDETKCGPAFATCAGANRRRAGIPSDIDRPDEEICTLVGQ